DGGEELPGQIAAGLLLAQRRLGLLVGVEDRRGDAGLRVGGGALLVRSAARGRVGAVERRQVRVVGRVAGRAVVGGLLGRGRAVGGGLSALVVDRHARSLG